MFKKNTAVTGFAIGHFINATTGAAVTTGTPTCKRMLDGTGAACANAAAYNTDAGQWEIDLAQADTNGDMVGLSFTLADCLPISYGFRTTTKLTSDLNDIAAGAEMTLTAAYDAAKTAATATALATTDGKADAIKAKTDLIPASPAAVGSDMGTVTSVTGAVGSVTGAVGSVTGNIGGNLAGSVGSVTGAVGSVAGAVGSVTGNVGGNVTGSVGSVVGAVGSVTADVTTDAASRTASKADVSTLATATNVTDATAAIRGAAGTETLDTLAADIAGISAGTAPTVEQIDTELTANHGAGLWTASAAGTGDTQVDHTTLDDLGTALTFVVGGAGISGATVRAYVTTEYAAATYTVRGSTRTIDNGYWEAPLMLNAGIQYTIEYYRPGYELATTTVTVT